MSMWTYVRGVILVDTWADYTPAALYQAQSVVDHLPRITGSEGPVQFYVTSRRGYNMVRFCDEYDQQSNLGEGRFQDKFKSQSEVLITLCGNLRDRMLPQTLRETTRALTRLASRLDVGTCLVSIEDDCGQRFLFNNPEWLRQIPNSDWLLQHCVARHWCEEEEV